MSYVKSDFITSLLDIITKGPKHMVILASFFVTFYSLTFIADFHWALSTGLAFIVMAITTVIYDLVKKTIEDRSPQNITKKALRVFEIECDIVKNRAMSEHDQNICVNVSSYTQELRNRGIKIIDDISTKKLAPHEIQETDAKIKRLYFTTIRDIQKIGKGQHLWLGN